MNAPLLTELIYLLGFIGLVSIGVVPLRSWQVLRNVFRSNQLQVPKRAGAATFAVLIVAGALWSDLQITRHIFRCLTETYCGPSVASGWTYLAMLGVMYLVFEVAVFVMHKIVGRT
jgi:hypothetical protein